MTVSKSFGLSMRRVTESDKLLEAKIIGDYSQILSICTEGSVNRIIVALDERRGKLPVEQLLSCRLRGIRVDDGMAFTEEFAGKLSVENLRPSSLIFSDGFNSSAIFNKMKRYIDVALGHWAYSLVAYQFGCGCSYQIRVKGARALSTGAGRERWENIHVNEIPFDASRRGRKWPRLDAGQ